MSDTRIIWLPDEGQGDWQIDGVQLATGHDLETALYISLFTDRQAAIDDVIPDGTTNRRGWWGDTDQKHPIGSRLWLLQRAKQTNETLARANDYVTEALQWFLDDQVVAGFEITVEWTRRSMLGVLIIAKMPDGKSFTFRYAWAWKDIN